MALAKFDRYITSTSSGATVPNASVQVSVASLGVPASLFSDREGLIPADNPFPADNNGRATFYYAADRYNMTVTGGGFSVNYTDIVAVPSDGIAEDSRVTAVEDDLANTNNIVGQLGANVGTLTSGVVTLENTKAETTVTDSLDQRVSTIESSGVDQVAELDTRLTDVEVDLTNTNTSVAALGSQVGSLNSSVTVLENTSATTTVTNALDVRLTDVEDDLTKTNTSVAVLGLSLINIS